MVVEQHSVLMSELWFPYESIVSVAVALFLFFWSSPLCIVSGVVESQSVIFSIIFET